MKIAINHRHIVAAVVLLAAAVVWDLVDANSSDESPGTRAADEVWGLADYVDIVMDPAQVALARQAAEESHLAALRPEALMRVYRVSPEVLPPCPPELLSASLLSTSHDQQAVLSVRATALALLVFLDPPVGQPLAARVLREGSESERLYLTSALGTAEGWETASASAELSAELLRLVALGGDNCKPAAKACLELRVPGLYDTLSRVLISTDPQLKSEMLLVMAEVKPSRQTLDACIEFLQTQPDHRAERACIKAVERVARRAEGLLAQEALEVLTDYCIRKIGTEEASGWNFPAEACKLVLERGKAAQAQRVIDAIPTHGLGAKLLDDAIYRAQRRMEPPDLRFETLMNDYMGPRPGRFYAYLAIREQTDDPLRDAYVTRLADVAAAPDDEFYLVDSVNLLVHLGGDAALAHVSQLLQRLPPEWQGSVRLVLHAKPPKAMLDALGEAGLLEAERVDAVLLRLHASRREEAQALDVPVMSPVT